MIYGAGGTGKSYAAYRIAEENGFDEIHWIRASNPIFMQEDLEKNLHVPIKRRFKKEELLHELQKMPDEKKIIFLFDNVCDPYLLKQLLGISCNVQIIVTTTLDLPVITDEFEHIQAKQWETQDIFQFLKNLNIDVPSSSIYKGRQTLLALKLYVACIHEEKKKCPAPITNLKLNLEQCMKYLYETLVQKERSYLDAESHALEIVRFASVLCGDFISFEILKQLTNLEKNQLEENLYCLANLSLIRIAVNGIYMHAQLQQTVRTYMGREQTAAYIRLILNQINNALESILIDPWKLQQAGEWRAHAETMLSDQFLWEVTELSDHAKLCFLAGRYDSAIGEYVHARSLLKKAKSLTELCTNELRQRILIELARVFEAENNNEGVIEEITQLQNEFPNITRESPAMAIDFLIILSQAYENKGMFLKSGALLKKGLSLFKSDSDKLRDIQNEKRVFLLNGIAKAYINRNRNRKALRILEKGKNLCKVGENYPNAHILMSKGCALYHLKRYQEAEQMFKDGMKIYDSFCYNAPTYHEFDSAICIITLYLYMEGKEELAKDYIQKARERMSKREYDYCYIEVSLDNQEGMYWMKKGNPETALRFFEHAIHICSHHKEESDFNAILPYLLANQSQAFYQCGKMAIALETMKSALKSYRNIQRRDIRIVIRYFNMYIKNIKFKIQRGNKHEIEPFQ